MPWEHKTTCSHYREPRQFDTPAAHAAIEARTKRSSLN
jgi:hypothetical protein